MSRRGKVALVAVLLVASFASAVFVVDKLGKRRSLAERRDLYGDLPVFPGMTLIGEDEYEIKADGRPTRRYGLRIEYALPDGTRASDVMSFYQRAIPAGWSSATDATCQELLGRTAPQAPVTTMPDGTSGPAAAMPEARDFRLMLRQSQLTLFAPSQRRTQGGLGGGPAGVTLQLSRRNGRKILALDEPIYSCGSDQTDRAAEDFNAP